MEEKIKMIKSTVEKLLEMLAISADVIVEDKNEGFQVTVDTQDSGLLIGHHGEGLNALQFIAANIVYKQTGTWEKIIVDVGGYREKRAQALKDMAKEYAEKVIETGEPATIDELSSFERRIVHLELQDNEKITTESEGEGRERRLVIKLKAKT